MLDATEPFVTKSVNWSEEICCSIVVMLVVTDLLSEVISVFCAVVSELTEQTEVIEMAMEIMDEEEMEICI